MRNNDWKVKQNSDSKEQKKKKKAEALVGGAGLRQNRA